MQDDRKIFTGFRRTVCTYAVGHEKFRAMALSMLLTVREHAEGSVDRYVIFTDDLSWRSCPSWIELVLLDCLVSGDRDTNWAIKPFLLSHPAVENDVLLYIDSDTTVYRDVITACFKWIEEQSLLVYMDFLPPDENWGRVNLYSVYRRAGFQVRNLKINAGIIGRKPDELGRTMTRLYGELFSAGQLKSGFSDEMYRKNDEPYLGLAVQLAYRQLGKEQAEQMHNLSVHDYALTIGASPRQLRQQPPVVRVNWYHEDIIAPAMIHWISSTQYLAYRLTLWRTLAHGGLLIAHLPCVLRDELKVLARRIRSKWSSIVFRLRDWCGVSLRL